MLRLPSPNFLPPLPAAIVSQQEPKGRHGSTQSAPPLALLRLIPGRKSVQLGKQARRCSRVWCFLKNYLDSKLPPAPSKSMGLNAESNHQKKSNQHNQYFSRWAALLCNSHSVSHNIRAATVIFIVDYPSNCSCCKISENGQKGQCFPRFSKAQG